MSAICEHVWYDANTALAVLPMPQPTGSIVVMCPCCGLRGYQDVNDHEANPCPYCAVDAVAISS